MATPSGSLPATSPGCDLESTGEEKERKTQEHMVQRHPRQKWREVSTAGRSWRRQPMGQNFNKESQTASTEQVILFRLRTGHITLNTHMYS